MFKQTGMELAASGHNKMHTKISMQERISAFADGELPDSEIEAVLQDLQTPGGRAAWDEYHCVGDLARSDDMAVPLSAGFAQRMAAQLQAEPTILAPAAAGAAQARQRRPALRRYAAPALGAVAVAAMAFVLTPHVFKNTKEQPATGGAAVMASASQPGLSHAAVIATAATTATTAGATLGDVEPYIEAHQRVSPAFESSASSAQYGANPAAAGGVAK